MFSRIYLPTIEGGGCSAGFICLLLRGGGGVQPDLFAYYWGGVFSRIYLPTIEGVLAGFICLLLRGGVQPDLFAYY